MQEVDGELFMGFNAAELLENFREISDDQRKEILAVVEHLKSFKDDDFIKLKEKSNKPQKDFNNLVIF